MYTLLRRFIIWKLKRAERHEQDKYFIKMFDRMIAEMEAVRMVSFDEKYPGREPRYRETIDKLVRAFAGFAVVPSLSSQYNKSFKPNYYQPGLPTPKASKDSNNQS